MADELDIEMRSECVGRHEIDVPILFERQQKSVDSGGDVSFYFGHDADFTKIDATVWRIDGGGAFESALLARELELKNEQNFSTDGPMFVLRQDLGPGVELVSSYASPDSADAFRLELHTVVEQSHVVLAETAYSTVARAAVQDRLVAMLPRLHGRASASGFCVGNVMFDFPADYLEADFVYAGVIDRVPVRLHVDLDTFAPADDAPGLRARGEANLEGLGVRTERLRTGPRALAGDTGEEWLGAFADGDRRLHGFYAETSVVAPTPETPKVLVSLFTGDDEGVQGAVDMGDQQAVALWDRLLGSMRRRGQ